MRSAALLSLAVLSLSIPRLEAQGPAALWKLEGNLADAAGKHVGKSVHGPAAFVPGAGGGLALSLDGNRFVEISPSKDLEFPRTTVELWFKAEFPPGLPGNPALMAHRVGHEKTRFSIHVASDYASLMLWNGRRLARFYPPLKPLEQGKWYFLAVTMTGGEVRFFLDGLPCEEGTVPARMNVKGKGYPLLLGAADPKGKERLKGALDEVALYDRILTPAEIARHMDAKAVKKRITLEEALNRSPDVQELEQLLVKADPSYRPRFQQGRGAQPRRAA